MQRHHAKEVIALRSEKTHLREAHRSRQPKASPPKGGEAESTIVDFPRATNLSVRPNIDPYPLTPWEGGCCNSRTPLSPWD